MPTEPEIDRPPINPRPGVVKTLGVCNIVFAVLSGFGILASLGYLYVANASGATIPQPKVTASTAPPNTQVVAINPFMGMGDPTFIRFSVVENAIAAVTSGLMFATGIGLLNLRRWAARWWSYLAWAKIALVVLLWGYFIVAVAPALSESMARNVAGMIPQAGAPGRGSTVEQLTMVYSIMNLVVAAAVIVVSSIYPAISLWLLGRPGVETALVGESPREAELP